MDKHFRPDERHCLIFGNYDYSSHRDKKGKGLADVPEAQANIDIFEE